MRSEYKELAQYLSGKDIAEIEIEALRDAEESGYQVKLNPYDKGSYAALVYTNACQKRWAQQLRTGTNR